MTPSKGGAPKGDSETYLHRIGRTGRFGTRGVALSLYDRKEDKEYLQQIVDEYSMNCEKLENPEQLRDLIDDLNAGDM